MRRKVKDEGRVDCGAPPGKHKKSCPQLRQIALKEHFDKPVMRTVLVESRDLIEIGPTHSAWKSEAEVVDLDVPSGAIVLLRPPVDTQTFRIDQVREALHASEVLSVRLIAPPRAAVLPTSVTEQPKKTERAAARDVITALVEESNTKDRDALRETCERVMGKVGL